MNILPKKRWHVRTKDNIARVRRDEADARRKNEEQKRRSQIAEQEVRINLLRKRARDVSSDDIQGKHVNFFKEIEDGEYRGGTNKDHEDEKKKKEEDFEKRIGLLNYLQDSVSGQNLWYLESPGERIRKKDSQSVRNVDEKEKQTSVSPADPLTDVQQYLKQKHLKEKTKKMSRKCLFLDGTLLYLSSRAVTQVERNTGKTKKEIQNTFNVRAYHWNSFVLKDYRERNKKENEQKHC
ncbi:leukocyte receptor cluster member 1 homolog isoform X3 [Tachypleus tridentatus]|uniref:leukocyte receptor cluster member 1 homolog isoform X3 n=1 Tax=Tachypleus tridentatus TaxID=6853 RepID=UPI003FD09288